MRSTAMLENESPRPLDMLRAELDASADADAVTPEWVSGVQRRRQDFVSFRRRQRWTSASAGLVACMGIWFGVSNRTIGTSQAATAAVPSSMALVSGAALSLGDGTLVQAHPVGDVQVDDLSVHGAVVRVRSGGVHARITHRNAQTIWTFRAGEFTVKVVGTEFDLVWDQVSSRLHVQMAHGKVRVFGPCLSQDGVSVADNASADFGAECSKELQVVAKTEPALQPKPDLEPPELGPAPIVSKVARPLHAASARTPEPTKPDEVPSAEAMLEQAHTARLRGNLLPAQRLYSLVEQSADASVSQRSVSVFELGRLNSMQGKHADALAAYQRLLAMGENTPLYEEGLARAAEEALAVGLVGEAQRLAQRYLSAFPAGSYAGQAKKMVGP